jgi:hypothetical protein
MKKLTTILTCLLIIISASAYTPIPSGTVSSAIQVYFEKDFAAASEVKWQQVDDIYVATFLENNEYHTAAYNEQGELLVTARYIDSSLLPGKVTRSVLRKYSGYTMDRAVVEMASETTDYLINVENEKSKLSLKVDEKGGIIVMSKTKK